MCWLAVNFLARCTERNSVALSATDIGETTEGWAARLILAYTMPGPGPLRDLRLDAAGAGRDGAARLQFLVQSALLGAINVLGSPTFLFGWHLVVEVLAVVFAMRLAWLGTGRRPFS